MTNQHDRDKEQTAADARQPLPREPQLRKSLSLPGFYHAWTALVKKILFFMMTRTLMPTAVDSTPMRGGIGRGGHPEHGSPCEQGRFDATRGARRARAELSEGGYLLRRNVTDWSAEDLWRAHIQPTDAETASHIQKSDLQLRPIWYQKEGRVRAHILV